MNTPLKVSLSLLVNFSLIANQVLANLPPISFEAPVYVPLSSVDGSTPGGWDLVSGNANVTAAGEGVAGGQALKLPKNQAETWLRKQVAWDAAERTAFIDFRIK